MKVLIGPRKLSARRAGRMRPGMPEALRAKRRRVEEGDVDGGWSEVRGRM